jgi:hypothetical protein
LNVAEPDKLEWPHHDDNSQPTDPYLDRPRLSTTVEDVVYLGLAMVLAGSAVGLLVAVFIDAARLARRYIRCQSS